MVHYRGKIWDGIQERRLGGFPERKREEFRRDGWLGGIKKKIILDGTF